MCRANRCWKLYSVRFSNASYYNSFLKELRIETICSGLSLAADRITIPFLRSWGLKLKACRGQGVRRIHNYNSFLKELRIETDCSLILRREIFVISHITIPFLRSWGLKRQALTPSARSHSHYNSFLKELRIETDVFWLPIFKIKDYNSFLKELRIETFNRADQILV